MIINFLIIIQEPMKIDAQIKMTVEQNNNTSEIASGWVEVEDAIKFPVKVRKYTDKNGEEKLFVSYPQRKNGEEWEGVLYPTKEMREEIDTEILNQMKNTLMKGIATPQIDEVRVNLINETKQGNVNVKAVASIKMCGFYINGITVKESKKGLFVNMPQYKDGDNSYHDMVYGTTKFAQTAIFNKVLEEYENIVKLKNQALEYQKIKNIEAQELSMKNSIVP